MTVSVMATATSAAAPGEGRQARRSLASLYNSALGKSVLSRV